MERAKAIPRWAVLLVDLGLCLTALLAAYQLRFNFQVPSWEWALLWPVLPLYMLVRLGSFLVAGIQRGMVRHTGTDDARRIFFTIMAGSVVLALLSLMRERLWDGRYLLPFSVLIIETMGALIAMIASRIAVKLLYLKARGSGKERIGVVIHGAGEAGLITKRTLEREGSVRYTVEAFVDDDPRKAGRRLEGVEVLHTERLPALLAEGGVDQVIIAIMNPDPEHRRRVVDACVAARVQVRSIPPVSAWINGQLSAGQIREVRIEDLLGRPTIRLDDAEVRARFAGERVLVTGAAGSIGSELCRQLATLGAGRLVLLDQAESPLHDLAVELGRAAPAVELAIVVGDVREAEVVDRLMAAQRPAVVFHAAAYKHVPLMELQPAEAVRTNVGGTVNVVRSALRHGVRELVLVSTDKAVNPTSVMGASKRVAELFVRAEHAQGTATRLITTRFGNVLGSSGSVIPLFRRQIAAGGPVTVTHPEVTRYFMTIPEACRLVLEAGTMGRGGEVYVFDMGQPVRIQDLAERMIRLSGKEPGRDIAIVHTGLRPGEKLYEELLAAQEDTQPTHHPRILIGRDHGAPPPGTIDAIHALVNAAQDDQAEAIVARMKALVPEYRSRNSVFEALDAPHPR
ncbi:MAG: polysaccharide biosynthesis protein [Flavobacteriales bacterium]|nr:UDP-N-acetyl-alpha-D-glucosamine C6 dehydratase [Flavobacteriales bacterium]MCC6576199.1 polysaccharide biosynthesis protein [Flavobacteriales bacterium]NUQ14965.1 polysaccharide biosynthesis protein [Flavobacteriales bacterium]